MASAQQPALARRVFLRGALGVIGLSLLSDACGVVSPSAPNPSAAGSGTGSGSSATPVGAFAYPSHIPFNGPKPDLAGGPGGLADAFFSYPADPVRSVTAPPGKGGDFNIFTIVVGGGAPPPLDQNPTWQQVNKDLNLNVKFIVASNSTDQAEKLSTIIAGGDLPDAMYLGSAPPINDLPKFLEASCADLTPYLAGDAVRTTQTSPTFRISPGRRIASTTARSSPCPLRARSPVTSCTFARKCSTRRALVRSTAPTISSAR